MTRKNKSGPVTRELAIQSNFTKLNLDKGKKLLESNSQMVNELHAIEVHQYRAAAASKMCVLGVQEEVEVTKKDTITRGVV